VAEAPFIDRHARECLSEILKNHNTDIFPTVKVEMHYRELKDTEVCDTIRSAVITEGVAENGAPVGARGDLPHQILSLKE
jgi:hypothetical protein